MPKIYKRKCNFCKSSYKGRGKSFCSNKCKGNFYLYRGNPHWKGGLLKRICKICGKEFFVMPCILKRVNGGKFCSRECFRKWNSGRNNPLWKEKIKRICKVCGKEFKVNSSVVKNGGGIFCSHSCGSIFQNKHSNRKFTSIELKIPELKLGQGHIAQINAGELV